MRLKVAAAQIDVVPNNKKENLRKITEIIDRAASKNVNLLVFPELVLTGYNCGEKFTKLAEPIPGPSTNVISKKAKEHGMLIAFTLPEKDTIPGIIYNTSVLIGSNGQIVGKYRKTHTALYLHWDIVVEEQEIFRKGNELRVFETEFGKMGLLICQDGDFPETWRTLMLKGAEIVAFSSASPKEFAYMWYNELTTMAFQNGYYIIAANRVGREEYMFRKEKMKIDFFGGSIIVDPLGRIVAKGSEFKEELIIADIDTSMIFEVRWATKLLRDRRPELYRDLCLE